MACLARSSLDTAAWREGTTFERGRGIAHHARRRVHENVVLSRSLTRLLPSRPAAVRRDPLGALRSGHRQIEIQQSYLQTLPAASTKSEQFIRVAEIDLLDDHGLAKDRRTKWQRQILLERGQEGRWPARFRRRRPRLPPRSTRRADADSEAMSGLASAVCASPPPSSRNREPVRWRPTETVAADPTD